MVVDLQVLLVLSTLIVLAEAVTEKIVKPIKEILIAIGSSVVVEKILDALTPYLVWALTGTVVVAGEITIFPGILPGLPGIIATAIVTGVGANRLHDILSFPKQFAQEQAINEHVYENWLRSQDAFQKECCLPEE